VKSCAVCSGFIGDNWGCLACCVTCVACVPCHVMSSFSCRIHRSNTARQRPATLINTEGTEKQRLEQRSRIRGAISRLLFSDYANQSCHSRGALPILSYPPFVHPLSSLHHICHNSIASYIAHVLASLKTAMRLPLLLLTTALVSSAHADTAVQSLKDVPVVNCKNGWVPYLDEDGSEGGTSCLLFSSTAVAFTEAHRLCRAQGASLLNIRSSNTYDDGGLLRFALDYNAGDCVSEESTCPVYWVGARRASEEAWTWTDAVTPSDNLNCGTLCTVWGQDGVSEFPRVYVP
jgi:hypothetical protein